MELKRMLALSALLALLVSTGSVRADAATTDSAPSAREVDSSIVARQSAAEGMVLLENSSDSLPIDSQGNVALFGVGMYATVKGGTGSGNVNNRNTVSVRTAFESAGYKITTNSGYYEKVASASDAAVAANKDSATPLDYSAIEQPLTSVTVRPTSSTETAVYVLARSSGEGLDRSRGAGDYTLTRTETENLKLIGAAYPTVVVVLNTGGIIDTSFFKGINQTTTDPSGDHALDALLVMSQPGQEAGNALVDVLRGAVGPSGHLTDTWASRYSYYPASGTFGNTDGNSAVEMYSEGIYVGYRYFDSFYKTINSENPQSVVNYPFGYGLSYTTFSIKVDTVSSAAGRVKVTALVTNKGTRSGKQVVQVYVSAPSGAIDTPYQELVGYAKTERLAPGQSQEVAIDFDASSMASYDSATSAWILQPGEYLVRVGDGSRSTAVVARLAVNERTVVDQVSAELDDTHTTNDLVANRSAFYEYVSESVEIAAAKELPVAGIVPEDSKSAFEQSIEVPTDSPYYAIDGSLISTTTAQVPVGQTDWEDTGSPYSPKVGEDVAEVQTNEAATLFDVYRGSLTMNQFVAGLSVDQLAHIVEGSAQGGATPSAIGAAGYTNEFADLGIPAMTLSDGPAGLRLPQQVATDPPEYQYATAFPIGTALAQTWNRELIQQVGLAVGSEMSELGVTLWLAPGMNIHRDPLCGRNFEYYSEDPLIAGTVAAAMTRGVQSFPGIGVTVKHFAANNQETERMSTDSVISERALREIYLRGFQIVVESSQPMAVMSSYNSINGTYAGRNYDLLTDVLRGEWRFQGVVMTDWTSVGYVTVLGAMYAGNDLVEPGQTPEEVVNDLLVIPPSIDITGLPVFRATPWMGATHYTWSLGGMELVADGDETITTRVDGETDLAAVPKSGNVVRDAINNELFTPLRPFGSVDAAYRAVEDLLAGDALDSDQKTAILVKDVSYGNGGNQTDVVTGYTVQIRGTYGPEYERSLRLGDLQNAASRVLSIAMQSVNFERLAGQMGIADVSVGSYSAMSDDLPEVMKSSTGSIRWSTFSPVLELSPEKLHAGDTTSVVGRGFVPGASVTVTFGTETVTASADPDGTVIAVLAIPSDTAAGTYPVSIADGSRSCSSSLVVMRPRVRTEVFFVVMMGLILLGGLAVASSKEVTGRIGRYFTDALNRTNR